MQDTLSTHKTLYLYTLPNNKAQGKLSKQYIQWYQKTNYLQWYQNIKYLQWYQNTK